MMSWLIHTIFTALKGYGPPKTIKGYGSTKTSLMVHTVCTYLDVINYRFLTTETNSKALYMFCCF